GMPSFSSARRAGTCDCSTSRMISILSDAEYLMPRLPIRDHAFFKQSVFEGEVGDDLLQGLRLAAKILHLVGGRGARRVAGKPPFTGLKELLRPAIGTSMRLCLRGGRARLSSPPCVVLPGRCGSSLQLKSVDASRAECA